MGLAKVIAWGVLAFILTGWLALVVAGLVYGLTTHHLDTHGPPGRLAVGLLLLLLLGVWAIRKFVIAYARYKFEKTHR